MICKSRNLFIAGLPVLIAILIMSCTVKAERDTDPDVARDDISVLVEGNNEFALEMYDALRDESPNIIFSPFSISMALGMTYAGAEGVARTEMADTLHFDLDDETLHAAFNSLDLMLTDLENAQTYDESQPFTLNIANSLWLNDMYQINPEFMDVVEANYGAGIGSLDFSHDPVGSAGVINEWIEDRTEGLITDAVSPDTLGMMVLLLVNAIYFNANWMDTFGDYRTSDQPFYPESGGEVTVPLMNKTRSYQYAEGDGYQAVSIPYVGGQTSMLVLLPESGGLQDLENRLTASMLSDIILDLEYTEVDLYLPRFEYRSDFKLAEILIDMGMPGAFVSGFESMLLDTGGESVFISEVIHKAYISVDEEGTEAAAVTIVEMGATSAPMERPEPVEFRADRPFIYFIRENTTGSILFIGRLNNPAI